MPQAKRYWDDVKEGQALPEVRVEKLTRTDFVKYAGASGTSTHPPRPALCRSLGEPDGLRDGHAQRQHPEPRGHRLCGATGRPELQGRFATRAWPGDDVICRGTVTRKFEKDGEKLVEGDLVAVNQKGETLISGNFVAALPSRF